ncbi:MAG: mannonate dehydratase [Thermomicrobiales bacterium]
MAVSAEPTTERMRIAIGQFSDMTDEMLRYAVQLGVTGVQMNSPHLPGTVRWEVEDLRALVGKAAGYGLKLEAIENVPLNFIYKAFAGLDGADEQIEHYKHTIRAVGAAGIPILGYNFMPNSVWTTSREEVGRGGSLVRVYDQAVVDGSYSGGAEFMPARPDWAGGLVHTTNEEEFISHEMMWANYEHFMREVLPVAKAAGVKLALHPDDPPVPMLGGVARILADPAGFKRAEQLAIEIGAEEAWGLDLCLGCCSEMPGGQANVREMIEHFGPTGRILYVQFRDVQGSVPYFRECYIGEGNYDPAEIMLLLKQSGFTGFLIDDHVPNMDGDSGWNHRGRAHAVGYMQGVLNAISSLPV